MKSYRPMGPFPVSSWRVESEFRGLRHIYLKENLQKSKSKVFQESEFLLENSFLTVIDYFLSISYASGGLYGKVRHAESESDV